MIIEQHSLMNNSPRKAAFGGSAVMSSPSAVVRSAPGVPRHSRRCHRQTRWWPMEGSSSSPACLFLSRKAFPGAPLSFFWARHGTQTEALARVHCPGEGMDRSARPLSLEVKLGTGEDWASRQAEGRSGSFHGPWRDPRLGQGASRGKEAGGQVKTSLASGMLNIQNAVETAKEF